jgi:triphosphatase
VQTIKAEGAGAAGLFDRPEWEGEIDGDGPDLSAVAGTALEPLLTEDLARRLQPLFETRVERTMFSPNLDGTEIAVALDHGEIVGGGHAVPVAELELELMHGSAGAVFAFASGLAKAVPVRLSARSKSDRGYALLDPGPFKPERAAQVRLDPGMATADAFRLIARSCLHQLVANEPGVVAGMPEALHQMRVGMRRLRAAMSVFGDVVADNEIEAAKRELRWIAARLGPTRDLDVLIAETLTPLRKAHPRRKDLAAVAAEAERRRTAALAKTVAAVRSARFGRAMLAVTRWIEVGGWTADADHAERRAMPVAAFAAEQLARRRATVLKRGRRLARLDAETRHEFRIRVKKLRYATEFFASLAETKTRRKRRDAALDAMRRLQDALGELNDIAVHERFVRGIVEAALPASGRSFAAGLLLGHHEERTKPLLAAACRAFDELSEGRRYWEKAD